MGDIIYWKEKVIKTIHCDHPKVHRIWEHGGLAQVPANGKVIRTICILLKGDEVPFNFCDYGDGWAVEQAEEFIKNLK